MDIRLKNPGTRRALRKLLPKGEVLAEPIQFHAYARDAGFYRLLPRIVVKAQSIETISSVFKVANKKKRHVVFRAGGTSLSGQSISNDILVEVKQGWREISVAEDGKQITLQPGVVAARANLELASKGYRIGPDPGSLRSALIGGIVANNASGIGSGTRFNSYQTLVSMEMVLPNGLVLNSEDPRENEKLRLKAPDIYEGLIRIREQIRNDPALSKRIINKYKLKNTMGYSLNSFLDYDSPVDILAHLMVGSEGTLGFISKVTLETVPLYRHRATGLIMLSSFTDAARLVPKLKKTGCSALEIMDDAAVMAVRNVPDLPAELHTDLSGGFAVLLVEYEADKSQQLNKLVETALKIIGDNHPSAIPRFVSSPVQREKLWKARRELGPLHAASRTPGTTVLSEDVCFKVKDLARAIKDLQVLFRRHHYEDAVIFGHAGDGNLHFKLSLDLSNPGALENYSEFIKDLVELVINKYDGSLKAEHGTGRNMAPFVEREWGSDAYQIMWAIKKLLDPNGILNPDVLLSHDEQIHLKNIKSIPQVNSEVDNCIECGLCEPVCPSADFTFTPRQRISVLREMEVLKTDDHLQSKIGKLEKAYRFHGVESCATDGLCAQSCPLDIDTGHLMKQFRAQKRGSMSRHIHRFTQRHMSATLLGVRAVLNIIQPLGYLSKNNRLWSSLKTISRRTGGKIPAINPYLSAARGSLPTANEVADVVYFPSCLTRSVGSGQQAELSMSQAFGEILNQADIKFKYPEDVSNLCCGLSFSSKGYEAAALQAAIQTTESLWISSDHGKLPIVMDTSPCSSHMLQYDQILSGIHLARWRSLKIYDVVEYLHDVVLEKLSLWHVQKKIVLHPTCSTRRMNLTGKMEAIAQRCAREVIIPKDLGCCAFAGDRGILMPDLTASATSAEATELKSIEAEGHYSTSRTCEIGMSLATDASYESIINLVHKAVIQPTQ